MNTERSELCWPNYPTSSPSLVKLPGQFTLIWEPGNMADARLQESEIQEFRNPSPLPQCPPHFCRDTL